MLVAFKLVVKADHFGAAAEPGSFKYLREQVYFGVPAFYPVIGLNMFKRLFFCFFYPLSLAGPKYVRLIFRDSIQLRRPQADLPFRLKSLCPSRRRSVRPAGSSCYCLLDPENLHTSEGRAGNVFASSFIFLRFLFSQPHIAISDLLLALIFNKTPLPSQESGNIFDNSQNIRSHKSNSGIAGTFC